MNKVGPLLAFLVLLAGCGGPTVSTASRPTANTASATEPAGLDIPTIGVKVGSLSTFGLDSKGNYQCPSDPQNAAWNRDGTVPGQPGLALIVASTRGVFQRLSQLRPGDPIYLSLGNGQKLTFTTVDATTQNSPVELQLAGCGTGTGGPGESGAGATAVYAELASK